MEQAVEKVGVPDVNGGASRTLHPVDALIPASPDPAFESLIKMQLIDGSAAVALSGVDQAIASLVRNSLNKNEPSALLIQVPRGAHETALLCGITAQLLCRQLPAGLDGPVTVISRDLDSLSRLRSLNIRGSRRMGLSEGNPLSCYRIRRDGTVQPAHGSYVGDLNHALLFLNTRVGWPLMFETKSGVVVVDLAAIKNPEARDKAIKWARDHGSRLIVCISDLGDQVAHLQIKNHYPDPLVVPFSWEDLVEIEHCLGSGNVTTSPLSSAVLLTRKAPTATLVPVDDPDIDDALQQAFRALAAMPKNDELPTMVQTAQRLVRNGIRLISSPEDYNRAASCDPSPMVSSAVVGLRRLERGQFQPTSHEWSTWGTVHWGPLLTATRALWNHLSKRQPKLEALWRTLETVARTSEAPITIRCASRASAVAVRQTIENDTNPARADLWNRIRSRSSIIRFDDRLPWSSVGTQILACAPRPDWLPSLLSGEHTDLQILAYRAELGGLRRLLETWELDVNAWRTALWEHLESIPMQLSALHLDIPESATPSGPSSPLMLPDVDLMAILDSPHAAPTSDENKSASWRTFGGQTVLCTPVQLADGKTWWAPADGADTQILRVTVAGNHYCSLRDLHPGDQIVIPTGDTRESIHGRMVAAIHRNADVASLDALLKQFRSCAASLIREHGKTAAIEAVRRFGAEAPAQLAMWASGETIAPANVGDVTAVFAAANRACPDLNVLYDVANTLRSLHRSLGRMVSALYGEREAVDALQKQFGDLVYELLDEFQVAEILSVGEPMEVTRYSAGRVV